MASYNSNNYKTPEYFTKWLDGVLVTNGQPVAGVLDPELVNDGNAFINAFDGQAGHAMPGCLGTLQGNQNPAVPLDPTLLAQTDLFFDWEGAIVTEPTNAEATPGPANASLNVGGTFQNQQLEYATNQLALEGIAGFDFGKPSFELPRIDIPGIGQVGPTFGNPPQPMQQPNSGTFGMNFANRGFPGAGTSSYGIPQQPILGLGSYGMNFNNPTFRAAGSSSYGDSLMTLPQQNFGTFGTSLNNVTFPGFGGYSYGNQSQAVPQPSYELLQQYPYETVDPAILQPVPSLLPAWPAHSQASQPVCFPPQVTPPQVTPPQVTPPQNDSQSVLDATNLAEMEAPGIPTQADLEDDMDLRSEISTLTSLEDDMDFNADLPAQAASESSSASNAGTSLEASLNHGMDPNVGMPRGMRWRPLAFTARGAAWTMDEEKAAQQILRQMITKWMATAKEVCQVLSAARTRADERCLCRRAALLREFRQSAALRKRKPDVVCKHLLAQYFSSGTKFTITPLIGDKIYANHTHNIEFRKWTLLSEAIQKDTSLPEKVRDGLTIAERGPDKLRTYFLSLEVGSDSEEEEEEEVEEDSEYDEEGAGPEDPDCIISPWDCMIRTSEYARAAWLCGIGKYCGPVRIPNYLRYHFPPGQKFF